MSSAYCKDSRPEGVSPDKKLNGSKILISIAASTNNQVISIYSQNISGGRSKLYRINDFLANTLFNIVAIQETWYDSSISNDELRAGVDFQIARMDRSNFKNNRTKGGGVCIFIRSNLNFVEIINPVDTTAEMHAIRITNTRNALVILNAYIPPYRARTSLINEVFEFIKYLKRIIHNLDLVVVGDLNLSNLNWVRCSGGYLININDNVNICYYEAKFIKSCTEEGLMQFNNCTNRNGKIIDLVLSNNINAISMLELHDNNHLDHSTLHHSPIAFDIKVCELRCQDSVYKTCTNIKLGKTKEAIALEMDCVPTFSNETADNDLIAKVCTFTNWLKSTQDRFTVKRRIKSLPSSNHPWTRNKKYKQFTKTRNAAQDAFRNVPSTENKQLLKTANINLFAHYKQKKQEYFRGTVARLGRNRSELFNVMRNRTKTNRKMPGTMYLKGVMQPDEQKLPALTQHLSGCFRNSLMVFSRDPDFLEFQLKMLHNMNYTDEHSEMWQSQELLVELRNLNDKKDAGPMGISISFLKFNFYALAPTIAEIFNACIRTGSIPQDWKTSFISPIPKKGAKNEITNYRGICLQSIIPKTFDKLLTKRIMQCLRPLIPPEQHGFIDKRSTTTNLVTTTQFIRNSFAKKRQVDCIYFDFSKAFDRIDHGLLAAKLALTSTPYVIFRLVMNFIIARTYKLKVDGVITNEEFQTFSSVPQGSHIGPLLFNLFVMDMVKEVLNKGVDIHLQYADDTKMLKEIASNQDQITLQSAIEALVEWSKRNRLDLNDDKCYHITFSRPRSNVFESRYFIDRARINAVGEYKDLGVTFDEHMTFKRHLQIINVKANNILHASRRFAKEIHHPLIVADNARSDILPIFEYAAIVWNGSSITQQRSLDATVQSCIASA